MNCKKHNGSFYTAAWKVFYPDCRRRILYCNAGAGAYVAAVTVCYQGL